MAKAEGRIFDWQDESHIRADFLETFEFGSDAEGRLRQTQLITHRTDEFSAVCPFSGLPDLGTVVIQYVPDKKCVEPKSLKYYFVSFRSVGIYQEAATDRISSVMIRRLLKLTPVAWNI